MQVATVEGAPKQFYMNSITTTLTMLLANPFVAEALVRYPEECCDPIQVEEFWQGDKWVKSPEMQSPSFTYDDGRTLYIGDFVRVRWRDTDVIRPAKIVRFYYRFRVPVRAWRQRSARRATKIPVGSTC